MNAYETTQLIKRMLLRCAGETITDELADERARNIAQALCLEPDISNEEFAALIDVCQDRGVADMLDIPGVLSLAWDKYGDAVVTELARERADRDPYDTVEEARGER